MRRLLHLAALPFAILVACGSSGSSSSSGPGTHVAGNTTDPSKGDAEAGVGPGVDPDAGPDAPASPKVDVSVETETVFGNTRSFVLAKPRGYDPNKSYPLVLAFHGDGGDGPSMRAFFPFDAVSEDQAFVAYPSGKDAAWDLVTPSGTNEDIQFIATLISDLTGRLPIDASRIFAAGFSRGAFFVNQLACRASIPLRAIASHSGGAPFEPPENHPLSYPSGYVKCSANESSVATLVFHGDSDTTVLPNSGDFDAMYWAYVNGCQDTRVSTTPAPCQKYDGCPVDKQVMFCLIPGLPHFVWADAIKTSWEFFKSQSQ